MSGSSTRKLLVLTAGFGLLVVAAVATTHKGDSTASEPAVVATTTPPVAAHAPTTGTHAVADEHKQDLDSFLAQAALAPCGASMPATITDPACRAAIEAHARRAGYGDEEVLAYLDARRPR
ncbi:MULTISPECIES: hypothetical protein [Pseudomonas]|uniref:Uncharacterized protein n=1 Tax=Pseudomonas benzopyrenica TaxID=2993566 RepID=A0ABZ2FU72_9PSED|nr:MULTISPECIES: hypothetical protein [Pseudomonas]MDC7829967.1 hypothetical protein [Pseudomonas benzopyrenica]UUW73386.1 hypothetical protein NRG74_08325 [Pseudomonas psychrotolerans]SEO48762.1 hypothetical protein SAMN02787149_101246 [Pseudomonas sp. Snoq117.2]